VRGRPVEGDEADAILHLVQQIVARCVFHRLCLLLLGAAYALPAFAVSVK
jgi:hypothetical protein